MKKVLLLLANGFETYEASVFIDVIGWNYCDGDKSTRLFSCGINRYINSSFDQKIKVDYLIPEINPNDYDALAIPGGFEEYGFYDDAYDEKFLSLIQKFNSQNKLIASICVGALPVGKSGILCGKKATTYNSEIRRNALSSFGATIKNVNIVIEENIITSSNPASAIEVAFVLLEKLTNRQNADHVKTIMGFSNF